MIKLNVNGESREYSGDPEQPLLWYLREELSLNGTKYGCGIGQCGTCTVHYNGAPVRACSMPMAAMNGANIQTIEGLTSATARQVQNSWQSLDVVQCGYCQSGQIMSAVALLEQNRAPSDKDINDAMEGNLCRCATYHRIRAAIHDSAAKLAVNAMGGES